MEPNTTPNTRTNTLSPGVNNRHTRKDYRQYDTDHQIHMNQMKSGF